MTTRADVVRVARSYLLTRWHHMGRLPSVGLDCAGVPVCIARELGLVAPDFDTPAYTKAPDGHSMIEWADKYMGPRVTAESMKPGHMLVARIEIDPQHIGIIGDYLHGGLSLIHAASRSDGTGCVVETRLVFTPRLRFVAAYQFPGVDDG